MSYGNLKERDGKLVIEIELTPDGSGAPLSYPIFEEVARSQGCVLEDGTGDVWRFVWDSVVKYVNREYDNLLRREWETSGHEDEQMYQQRIDAARASGDEKAAGRLEFLRECFAEEEEDEDYDDYDDEDEEADVYYPPYVMTENRIAEDVEPASRSFW